MGSTTAKALRYGPCAKRGSHSFTYHPHMNRTCLYSPTERHHRPFAGTHCAYPRRDGQAELTWVAGHIPRIEINVPHRELNPNTVIHLSTNRALRWLTSLIEANALTTTPGRHLVGKEGNDWMSNGKEFQRTDAACSRKRAPSDSGPTERRNIV